MLCEALINTGIAGCPKEYFEALVTTGLPRRPVEYFENLDDAAMATMLESYSRLDHEPIQIVRHDGESYASYLSQVFEEGTTPNGVFGAKVMWGYFDDFINNLRQIPYLRDLLVPDMLSITFPNLRYLWITRQDKLRQAVSLWRAIQSGIWRADEIHDGVHKSSSFVWLPETEPVFHFRAIDHLVDQITSHEASWQNYFRENGIEPYIVVYEDLVCAYEVTCQDILRYLHIPIPEGFTPGQRRMLQQADDLSEAWVRQYNELKVEAKIAF
jgi:LPS sulfotransferase NodH